MILLLHLWRGMQQTIAYLFIWLPLLQLLQVLFMGAVVAPGQVRWSLGPEGPCLRAGAHQLLMSA